MDTILENWVKDKESIFFLINILKEKIEIENACIWKQRWWIKRDEILRSVVVVTIDRNMESNITIYFGVESTRSKGRSC